MLISGRAWFKIELKQNAKPGLASYFCPASSYSFFHFFQKDPSQRHLLGKRSAVLGPCLSARHWVRINENVAVNENLGSRDLQWTRVRKEGAGKADDSLTRDLHDQGQLERTSLSLYLL